MKFFCFFGMHKMRVMPWMRTRDRSPKPDRACIRCGKIKYNWVMYISNPFGGFGQYMGRQYEGQSPPKGYSSWDNYYERMDKAREELIRRAR